jgi:UDP-2,4-diacetamido-2,4,6-trideoxy-beta-L-altropyranose hydrolase
MAKKILIRADGSTNIGMGHIMRCLALADGLRRRDAVVYFATKEYDQFVMDKIGEEKFHIFKFDPQFNLKDDAREVKNIVRKEGIDAIVTDSYGFDALYFQGLKEIGKLVVAIDDLAKIHHYADIVFNGNSSAFNYTYMRADYTKLYLGTDYILLRDEFREKHNLNREIKEFVENILITFGGVDSANQTMRVLKVMQEIRGIFKCIVVLGKGFSKKSEIEQFLKKSEKKVEVYQDVKKISDFMMKVDMAISAAGSTLYEFACLGLPAISFIMADNQRAHSEELHRAGVVINLGRYNDFSDKYLSQIILHLMAEQQTRLEMSQKGKELVDGKGVERTSEVILNAIS